MDPQLQALLERGEESECLEYSEVDALVEALELGEEELEDLYEEVERRRIELRDDCGREAKTTYVNGDLAVATTDALQLFMQEIGRYPLLTKEQEIELSKRVGRGDGEVPVDVSALVGVWSRAVVRERDAALLQLLEEPRGLLVVELRLLQELADGGEVETPGLLPLLQQCM